MVSSDVSPSLSVGLRWSGGLVKVVRDGPLARVLLSRALPCLPPVATTCCSSFSISAMAEPSLTRDEWSDKSPNTVMAISTLSGERMRVGWGGGGGGGGEGGM